MSIPVLSKLVQGSVLLFTLLMAPLWSAETVALSASTATPSVGASFTVTVSLAGASPFANWQTYLAFDPAKVQLTAQAAGTFTTFVPDGRGLPVINAAGNVGGGGLGFIDNAGGSGSLGVFTFTALSAGSTAITTQGKSSANLIGVALTNAATTERVPGLPGPLAITIGGGTPTNLAPIVNAGADQTITLPATASLIGTVTDDGLPAPATLTLTWSKVSGPGTVSFAPPNAAVTTATFSAAGTYVLQLLANDGDKSSTDQVTVTVNPVPAVNAAPTVNAGPDKTITLPATASLTGTVTDDGLPAPATLTLTWSKVSGPGTVSFAPPNAAVTTATFSAAGTYVLQLLANDNDKSSTDQVTVTVNPDAGGGGNPGPAVGGGGSGGSGGCGLGSGFAALLLPGLLLTRKRRTH